MLEKEGGMTPTEHEEHRGYAPVADALERARALLDAGHPALADGVLVMLAAVDALLAEDSHRGEGARMALDYHGGTATLEQLRTQAAVIVYGHAVTDASSRAKPIKA